MLMILFIFLIFISHNAKQKEGETMQAEKGKPAFFVLFCLCRLLGHIPTQPTPRNSYQV